MIWRIICCLIGGYLIGCISTGYLVGKLNKVDIRKYGSGSAGTTNAMRTLGRKAGIITFIGDFLKAVIPILLVRFVIFRDSDYNTALCLYSGIGIMLGHNFPFWLKFKGGKGIAVTGGVVAAIAPEFLFFGVATFAIVVVITKYVSLGSLVGVPVAMLYIMYANHFDLHIVCLCLVFIISAYLRHRTNIVRLIRGTENKVGQRVKIDKENQENGGNKNED